VPVAEIDQGRSVIANDRDPRARQWRVESWLLAQACRNFPAFALIQAGAGTMQGNPMRRRLTTILAADVAGYSRLAGADEEGTVTRLRALQQELIDPLIAAKSGRIVKTTGDGRLIEFASVVDAVRCAVEVQRGMQARNTNIAPDRRIEFRVGIHLGDVIVESDGDLMGDGVNIAARLEGIAEPGGICLSEDAWRQVRDKIDAEFSELGDKELKNIARPVRVYALMSGAASPTPAPHAAAPGKAGPPPLSIVVLPFANLGGDPEQEYFVDGVTESLTTDLSCIAGSFVIGRNTAFTFKGKAADLKQIGRDLGVRYVLEGSVQRAAGRMRVNVQLIDAETGTHLWAERFDKKLADLFDMQDEIVARLANQLNAELIALEARRAERSPRPDSTDLYFQGQAWANKGLNPEYFARARALFERALVLDRGNIDALVGQGRIDAETVGGALTHDRAAHLAAAEAALTKALSLAPNHAWAHTWMGLVYIHSDRPERAVAEGERALTLDRNLAHGYCVIGLAKTFLGRAEETEAHIHEAFRLSPRDTNAYIWAMIAGYAKLHIGDDAGAELWLRQSIETNRNLTVSHFFLAAALAHLGRQKEAQAAAQAGLAVDPTSTVSRYGSVLQNPEINPTFRAQRERVIDGMRKAGMPEE
jgi:TolB-like protein/class 3 adenylate cyclase/Flp pilus assembly protein TadD